MINKIFNTFSQNCIQRKLFHNIKKICMYLYIKGMLCIEYQPLFKSKSFKRIIKIET